MTEYYTGDHEFDNGDGGQTKEGKCVVGKWNGFQQKVVPCGLEWTSVAHPPDQFRHWCGALEAGYDCMHFEDVV